MEIGDAFRTRIEGRIGEAIEKYFDGGFSGHVTVEKSGPRFSADCVIFLDSGMALAGRRPGLRSAGGVRGGLRPHREAAAGATSAA